MSIFIVAEIGINHNGDMSICKQLIDVAISAGCDAVKFQKRDIDKVYTKDFLDSPRESPWGTTQREQKLGLEFDFNEYEEIDQYCKASNIEWFASAWDLNSQAFLQQFDCKYNKVASAMIVYGDLLRMIAKEGKHTFISTGMTTYDDIQNAVDIFNELIDFNKKKYKHLNVDFRVLDITSEELPSGEVCLVRQVLQHLSNESIMNFVNLAKDKYKYLIITEHFPTSKNFIANIDKPTGFDIRFYDNSAVVLTKSPFNLKTIKEALEN